jgi:SAM-dependent methyltransferase
MLMPAQWRPGTESGVEPLHRCPRCLALLARFTDGFDCQCCREHYGVTAIGQPDFRLEGPQPVVFVRTYVPMSYAGPIAVPVHAEAPRAVPRNAYHGPIPAHLTAAQISWIPSAPPGGLALDLGCGSSLHRPVLEALGYAYHGADYAGTAAADLVDAHALPYADGVFDLVLAIALVEHLADPVRAISEIFRTLRRGGCFVGTSAFLEPFHDNSFFHPSHLGLWRALRAAGFDVETLLVIKGWDAVRAQVEMGFGSRLPRLVNRLIALPFAWATMAYATLGRRYGVGGGRHGSELVLARHAGAFFFVAHRRT